MAVVGTGYCFECWPGGPIEPPPCLRCGARRGYYADGFCEDCHPSALPPRKRCRGCRSRPVAIVGTGYCFECWPGGPVAPPPCLRCGARRGYHAAGLCVRCHPRALPGVDACLDCQAWGATRTRTWLCKGCTAWRAKYPVGDCRSCGRRIAVDGGGACRLCRKQRTRTLRLEGSRWHPSTLLEANQHGQQLFLADMFRVGAGPKARGHRETTSLQQATAPLRAVVYRQLVLFAWPHDLRTGVERGLPPLPDLELAEALHRVAAEHAARHGWKASTTEPVQRGIRYLLATQDTPGAPIRESEVLPLSQLGISARGVLDVLADAAMLEPDREPAIVRWFRLQLAEFPERMQHELLVWFDVRRHGSTTPPRYRPRSDHTTASQFRFALPALRRWATRYESLREVGREDVLAALPASGTPRATMLQGLRSIFRVLKARQLVFVNPTARLSVPTPHRPIPAPIDLAALRALLDADDPARAALAALLAFHAVRVWQLCALTLSDLHDGRLHIGEQTILLADPVRKRLTVYLDYRARRWPATVNPHLFVNDQSHGRTRPVSPWWIRKRLGMSGQAIRQDRILDEAHASSGDIRRLSDLFGLSIAGAYRYTATVDHIGDDASVRS